ncbi:RAD9 [Candida pseudojiufengensis]|uniref:RAD9 n=1 Tax=Candida pseudojiufengensis TaxID=497109 RepID=UPI002224F125|nr:RAD9 [Candida pseudojiufengensis]KAI5958749.1 RAD9 [Candida pseudojiufengensis]
MNVEDGTQVDFTQPTGKNEEATKDQVEHGTMNVEDEFNSSLFQQNNGDTQLINENNSSTHDDILEQINDKEKDTHTHNVYSQDTQKPDNISQPIFNDPISLSSEESSSTQNLNSNLSHVDEIRNNDLNGPTQADYPIEEPSSLSQLDQSSPKKTKVKEKAHIHYSNLADTQVINKNHSTSILESLPDTQIIPQVNEHLQQGLVDTQVIPKVHSPRKQNGLMNQKSPKKSKKHIHHHDGMNNNKTIPTTDDITNQTIHTIDDENNTQLNQRSIRELPPTQMDLADTQIINNNQTSSTEEPSSIINNLSISEKDNDDDENNPFIVKNPNKTKTDKNEDLYDFKYLHSHRQVINTQEEPDTSLFHNKSNKSKGTIEVQTDDEKDISHDIEEEEEEEEEEDEEDELMEEASEKEKEESKEIENVQEKVQEDEEEESEVPITTELKDHFEDSLIAYRKRRLSHSPLKLKRSKTLNESEDSIFGLRGNNNNSNGKTKNFFNRPELLKTPGTQIRNYSEPLIFASPFDNIQSSSSPSKKIENINKSINVADQSIRTDEDEITIDDGKNVDVINDNSNGIEDENENVHDDTNTTEFIDDVEEGSSSKNDGGERLINKIKNSIRQQTPPSSPSKITEELSDINENDYDYDDYDDYENHDSYNVEDDKTVLEIPIIARRRRRNNIIESQSNGEDTAIIDEDHEEAEEEQADDNQNEVITGILRKETNDIIYTSNIKHKESVWASYNLKMYTGEIITRYSSDSIIKFQNNESSNIKNEDLNYLDIRIGDNVYILGDLNLKYIVTGLSRDESLVDDIKCIRGFNLVYLKKLKKNWKSKQSKVDKEIIIPLSQCWMELEDWMIHQQKFQILDNSEDDGKIVTSTQITSNSIVGDDNSTFVTTTNNKRNNFLPTTPTKLSRHSSNIENLIKSLTPSPSKNKKKIKSSIFVGYIFFITNINDDRKNDLKNKIEMNGGIYLDCDLFEIFNYESQKEGGISLKFKNFIINDLKFGCLLSSNYCRSSKYLQTLSLNWPILSDRFIDDCLQHQSLISQWEIYILPSGFSKFLNCIKSLNLVKFQNNFNNGATLINQLSLNSNLLRDYDILNLHNNLNLNFNNSKIETCEFIFHSFGANSLNNLILNKNDQEKGLLKLKLKSISELNPENKILIYDNGNLKINLKDYLTEQLNYEEESKIISRRMTTRSKRIENEQRDELKQIDIYIIDWEWVVQCVISGYIWEPNHKLIFKI